MAISPEQPRVDLEPPCWNNLPRILAWVLVIGLLILLGWGLVRAQQGNVQAGQPAPDFTLETFDGETYSLDALRGKVVVVNFWASWCVTCDEEALFLQEAWEVYEPRGDVVFLGVDYADTEPDAKAFLEHYGITYPNGPDKGTRIAQAYRIQGVPETYFISRDGILAFVQIGPFLSLASIQEQIDLLVEQ
ncbi:MAG: TlpA disulfide reductase family protein [Chloroflexota bacterium]